MTLQRQKRGRGRGELAKPAFAAQLDPEETRRSTLVVLDPPAPIVRALVIDRSRGVRFHVHLAPAEDGTLYVRITDGA